MPRPRAPWWIHLCAASLPGLLRPGDVFDLLPARRRGYQHWNHAHGRPDRRERDRRLRRQTARAFSRATASSRSTVAGFTTTRIAREFDASVSVGEERTWLFERSGRQFSVTLAPHRRQFFPSSVFYRSSSAFSSPWFFLCSGLQPARGSRRQARRAPARVDRVRVGAPLANRPRGDVASLACRRRCAAVACLPEHDLYRPDRVQPVRGVSAKRHPPKLDLDRRAHARSGGHSVGRGTI